MFVVKKEDKLRYINKLWINIQTKNIYFYENCEVFNCTDKAKQKVL